jgi:SAM-dependent methyltransferase
MSGFEARWLDLREPVDHAARDGAMRQQVTAFLAPFGSAASVVDLGCGTGSTFRALLPEGQGWRWLLVDNDPLLLAEAKSRHGYQAAIAFTEADLAGLDGALFDDAHLVTASALFDLTSAAFVDNMASQLRASGTGLYAALNYDGTCRWTNPHPADAEVVSAFNMHQQGEKGFGQALGPESGPFLQIAFEAVGYHVSMARSPWIFTSRHAELHRQFIEGMASAVSETRSLDALVLEDWRRNRLARAEHSACEVGHWDVLALPQGR